MLILLPVFLVYRAVRQGWKKWAAGWPRSH